MKERGYEVFNYDPYYYPQHSLLKGVYDFIACSEVVEHFYSPQEEFILLNGLLKGKGGVVGIMTEMLEDDSEFGHWWYHSEPTHVCFYEKKTFRWIGEWLRWKVEFPQKNIVIFEKR